MIVPALIFTLFNTGTPTLRGWGIPMATDIAFALGILSIFGSRVPVALKVFLAALAIADDIGAILVIALFYTEGVQVVHLFYGFGFLGVLVFFNFIGVRSSLAYAVVGFCGLWLSFLLSGIHPSVAGVLAAFAIPARSKLNAAAFLVFIRPYLEQFETAFGKNQSTRFLNHEQMDSLTRLESAAVAATPPLQKLEGQLHPWVSFLILPLFALANAGVKINFDSIQDLSSPLSLGVICGLFFGKQLGIFFFAYATVKLGLTALPDRVNWKMIYAASCLAGIGFTMSLFISALAFKGDSHSLESAKLAILTGSLISAIVGCFILTKLCPKSIKS
jgi:NhaA family Na+:H+ antiporter